MGVRVPQPTTQWPQTQVSLCDHGSDGVREHGCVTWCAEAQALGNRII